MKRMDLSAGTVIALTAASSVAGCIALDWNYAGTQGSTGSGGAGASGSGSVSHSSSSGNGGAGGSTLCAPGATASCYSGPDATIGMGDCKAGLQTCRPDGNGYLACMGAVTPVPENCTSGKDTDCNNTTTLCTGATTWSAHDGDMGDDEGLAVAVDSKGSVIVTGSFNGSIDFGKGMLASKGGADIVVLKYDRSGKALWTRRFGGAGDDFGRGVAVDSLDNVIVVGSFATQADFDPASPLQGTDQGFVVKLAPTDGAVVWTQGFGDAAKQAALAVAVDPNDDILIAGGFSGALGLGADPISTGSNNDEDAFVAKLRSADGGAIWANRVGDAVPGMQSQRFTAIAVDASLSVIVTGTGRGDVDFGGGPVTSHNNDNILVAKYAANGAHTWGKIIGDDGDFQGGNGVAADKDGSILVTGRFAGKVQFPGGAMLTAVGVTDAFLVKLDPMGQELWSKDLGDTAKNGADSGFGVAVDQFGNVAIGGVYQGSLDLLGGGNLPFMDQGGTGDVFVAKYDPLGTILWARSVGGAGYDVARAMAVSRFPVVLPGFPAPGSVVLTGSFGGTTGNTIDFGMNPFTCVNGKDLFVADLAP
jgi:hypothetical protein